MKRCVRCLYPETKPDLHFDADGVCSACIAFDARQGVDWGMREIDFCKLLDVNKGGTHDVIVACSGGKDSTAQIVKVLQLGYRPLAVTATTDDLSPLGRRNLDNVAKLCDHVEVTAHVPTRRKISKFALQEVGDISWCEHHLIWSIPVREAVQRKIPIVLYGECPQNEYGAGPAGSADMSKMTKDWIHEFGGLLGMRLSDVADQLNLDQRNLDVFNYPAELGYTQAIFMGYYFAWDGFQNAILAEKNGFSTYERDHVEGSLFNYENLDNHQTGIHDYLRFLKFGYGRCIDIACSHIRRGRMTREEAWQLVSKRDGAFPWTYLGQPIEDTLGKIGVGLDEFMEICDRFANKAILVKTGGENGTWKLQSD